ncbi:MAG: hypothetical protein ACK47B_21045 [Armatimonadota bacterium]
MRFSPLGAGLALFTLLATAAVPAARPAAAQGVETQTWVVIGSGKKTPGALRPAVLLQLVTTALDAQTFPVREVPAELNRAIRARGRLWVTPKGSTVFRGFLGRKARTNAKGWGDVVLLNNVPTLLQNMSDATMQETEALVVAEADPPDYETAHSLLEEGRQNLQEVRDELAPPESPGPQGSIALTGKALRKTLKSIDKILERDDRALESLERLRNGKGTEADRTAVLVNLKKALKAKQSVNETLASRYRRVTMPPR